jgi:hypothetical protein
VVLTNVVVRFAPFHRTTELLMNPLPLTVSVKAAPPAVALEGEIEVMAGTGARGLVIVPPVPVIATALPDDDTAALLATPTDVLATPAPAVKVTTATVPFGITVEFRPEAIHL